MSISFAFGPIFANEIKQEKIFAVEIINEIQVNMTSELVHIVRTESGNEVKFHFYGNSMRGVSLVTDTNNKTIEVFVKREFGLPFFEELNLDIYIPAGYRKNISIRTTSGNVRMDSVDLQKLLFNITSGKFEAETIKAEDVFINTSSGNIHIKKIDVKIFEIEGTSAKVYVEECITKEACLKTTSGNITLEKSSGSFNVKGTSGNVMIDYMNLKDQYWGQNLQW